MSKKQIGFADLRVGIVIILSLVILIGIILTISGDINPFQRKVIIKTHLSSVDGLRSGAEVRLAGVKVGQVRKVSMLPVPANDLISQTVELELALDPVIDGKPAGERIRKDSKVILGSVGLLGDKVVDIIPGTKTAPAITKNYEEIEGSQETTIRQLVSGADDILANFTTLSESVKQIAEKISKGEGTVGRLVTDQILYENLNQAVEQSQKLVRDVREGKGTAGRLISDPTLYNEIITTLDYAEKLISDISSGKGTLGKLATDEKTYNDLSNIIARLDSTTIKIQGLVDQVNQGEGNLGLLFKDEKLYREIESTFANLNLITTQLEHGEGSAGHLLKDPSLYENLNLASEQTTKLLTDFRQNPKKYLTIKLKLF